MEKQSKLRSFLGVIRNIVVDFCTVTGLSLFTIYQKTANDYNKSNAHPMETSYIIKLFFCFIYENFFLLLLATIFIALIIEIFFVPKYKIHKKGIAPAEAKPSTIKIILMGILLFTSLLACVNIYLLQDDSVYADDNDENNNDENINYYKQNNNYDDYPDDYSTNSLTLEEIMISEYIIRCYSSVIPVEEWTSLSDSQIKYIYNGILAYSGMHFQSQYYERFSWYEDKYLQENFPWKILNSFQEENLNNLRDIRVQRGELVL